MLHLKAEINNLKFIVIFLFRVIQIFLVSDSQRRALWIRLGSLFTYHIALYRQ
jgi:hypothetical protein